MAQARAQARPSVSLDASQAYLFDTMGFVIIRGALSPAEVAAANAAVDRNRETELRTRDPQSKQLRLSAGSRGLEGAKVGRQDCGTALSWPSPDGDVFRRLLAHPALVPYLNALCCPGYRLDHSPLIIVQRPGAEGFALHGGNVGDDGGWNYTTAYTFQGGRSYNALLNMSVALTDSGGASGGLAVMPGSHKSNLPSPQGLRLCEPEYRALLTVPEVKAGDVVLFSEGTLHGTLPWSGEAERRAIFYRFTMPNHAYARGYTDGWGDELLATCDDAQRSVLEPPYAPRINRATLRVGEDGETVTAEVGAPRDEAKVEFDRQVFGRPFF